MKLRLLWAAAILAMACAHHPVMAQTGEQPDGSTVQNKQSDDAEKAIEQTLAKISKLVKAKKFEEASKLMTKSGANDFTLQPVAEAIMMSSQDFEGEIDQVPEEYREEMEAQMEAMQESIEQYKELLEKHGLDDIDVDVESEEGYTKLKKLVNKKLDKSGKRWEIFKAFEEVGSQGMPDLFSGESNKTEIDGKTASVQIKPDYAAMMADEGADMGDGEMMEVMGPDMVLSFKKTDAGWLYNGIDEEKTEELMMGFMDEMGGGFGGEVASVTIEDTSFSGKTSDGKEIKLEDYKGSVVLVDFWGTWCKPCVASLPELGRIHDAMKGHGFEVIGIANDSAEKFDSFNEKRKLGWPNVIDGKGRLADKFGVTAFPTTLLIDADGNHVGTDLHGDALVAAIAKHLGLSDDELKAAKAKMAKAKANAGEKGKKKETKAPKKADKQEDDSEETATDEGGFSAADADSNGEVSKAELKSYLKDRMGGNIPANKVFRKLDEDKSKGLSNAEFEKRFDVIQSVTGDGQLSENGDASRYGVADPGPNFIPLPSFDQRVDDKAIFGAVVNRYFDAVEDKTRPWPKLDFGNLPKSHNGTFSFGAADHKSTVMGLAKATLVVVADDGGLATAGGVMISEDGLAITNYHVAEMAKSSNMGAMTSDGKMHRVIEVLAGSNEKDVALIRLEGSGFTPVSIAKTAPSAGDDIVMLHHSENRFYTFDRGYVRRNSKIGRNTRMEISSEYAPGGSGCGIYNANHELVGIVCEINMGDGPALAGGNFEGDPHQENFIVVKHAVHLSAIQSLWSETGMASTSAEDPVPSTVAEPTNAKEVAETATMTAEASDYKFESKIFKAPVMLSAGEKPMKVPSGYPSPAIFDVDNDGKDEMVLGGIGGELVFCENEAESGSPQWGKTQPVRTANGKAIRLNNW